MPVEFSKRSTKKELLDRDDIPFGDIRRNMQELDFINTWLGGHAISVKGLATLLRDHGHLPRLESHSSPPRDPSPLTICEIGCGGGDNLRVLSRYCRRRNIEVRVIGIDSNPHCIDSAREKWRDGPADWILSDYREVGFEKGKPDIIFSSLFCHHFTDNDLVHQVKWMGRNAMSGWFINDLQRHPFAYYAIKSLTGCFSRSYLVRNDAPLSVLRGFTRQEFTGILDKAGITGYSLQWKWAFRWLIIGRPL
jgi:2-polyprenyl-3-methyl-5-hydroxy-6-metoxy-1,4-benzoquinol methylase